jgi:hypothetical protein
VRLPIRARLTAWYVALLALVIAALGAFVVIRLRADLTADFDRSLRSAAAQLRAAYEREGPGRFDAVCRRTPARSSWRRTGASSSPRARTCLPPG